MPFEAFAAIGVEMPPSFWTDPLMYQGGSDSFIGPNDEIELGDGKLILLDDEGSSYECRPFTSYREAKRTIRAWTRSWPWTVLLRPEPWTN